MFGNILPLTGLCIVWSFILKARCDVFYSEIERDSDDIFTNEYCENCSYFGADNYAGRCKCQGDKSDSLLLRSKRHCKSGLDFKNDEKCLNWFMTATPSINVKVINVTEVNRTYRFSRERYSPCQLTSFIAFLDASGNWNSLNLSGNVLDVKNGDLRFKDSYITITQKSQSLTNLSGHVIKLGLNCTGANPRLTCLLFRVKGVLKFPLCNYTLPSTPPSPSPSTSSSTAYINVTSTAVLDIPPPATPPPSRTPVAEIIAGTLGAVIFLALIGAVIIYFLYKRNYICKSRNRQAIAAAVIPNPAQQTERENEEHVYDDLLEVCSSNEQISGNATEMKEITQSEEEPVLLVTNPYVTESTLSSPRPLLFRPDQNNGHDVIDQIDVSMVVENPGVQGIPSRSLPPREWDDFDHQQEASEEREPESDHHQHQHHHEDIVKGTEQQDTDYQGLEKGKRAQSMFICPSCNANSDYQRLSRPEHCPHEGNQEWQEKSRSFYVSLTPERGGWEPVYMNPSHTGVEEQDNAKKLPDYQTLEPEETEPNDAPDKPTSHVYNVLEEPEQAITEAGDEDKKLGDPIRTDKNAGDTREPSVSHNTENIPVYAVPCKKKKAKETESACNELDEDNNKMVDARATDEVPSELLDPSVFVKMEDNPAYALPWKKETAKEAESACNELDENGDKIDDAFPTSEDPSEPWDPSVFVELEDNPAYALPEKKKTAKDAELACYDLDEEENKTDDTRF